jgi:hypothetical protein
MDVVGDTVGVGGGVAPADWLAVVNAVALTVCMGETDFVAEGLVVPVCVVVSVSVANGVFPAVPDGEPVRVSVGVGVFVPDRVAIAVILGLAVANGVAPTDRDAEGDVVGDTVPTADADLDGLREGVGVSVRVADVVAVSV